MMYPCDGCHASILMISEDTQEIKLTLKIENGIYFDSHFVKESKTKSMNKKYLKNMPNGNSV